MGAVLDLATRAALVAGLVLAAAWASAGVLDWALARRGSVWHVPPVRRRSRVLQARVLAMVLAAAAAAGVGWCARSLGFGFWGVACATVAACGWAGWRVAAEFARTIQGGETLLAGAGVEELLHALPASPPHTAGRRIVILCDGTGNCRRLQSSGLVLANSAVSCSD